MVVFRSNEKAEASSGKQTCHALRCTKLRCFASGYTEFSPELSYLVGVLDYLMSLFVTLLLFLYIMELTSLRTLLIVDFRGMLRY